MPPSQTGSIVQHLRRTVLRDSCDGLGDGALLQGFIADRDGAMFEALVERHGPMVWGVCRRVLGNVHDAEDAFQATFLVLARKAASVRPREKLPSWLYGVACQTAVRVRCARARRQSREKQVPNMPEPAAPEQPVWENLQPLLDAEIARLPTRYREVVILGDLQGHTRREVARRLRIPEGTVASRLATARRMLAKRLARASLSLTGTALAAMLMANASAAGAPPSAVCAALRGVPQCARVAALAEEVLKAMLLTKLKGLLIAMLVLAIGAYGGRMALHAMAAGEPEPQQPAQRDDPKREKKSDKIIEAIRTDRFGDALPDGAIARLGTLRFRHPFWVRSLAYTPDEKTLVSACADGAVRLWDPATGKELRCFPGAGRDVAQCEGVVVTPDGKTVIAIENTEGMRAWDIATGKERWQVKARNGFALVMAPDGRTIAKGLGGDDRQQVSLWDADTGKHLRTLGAIKRSVAALAYSQDGKLLAAGDGASISHGGKKTDNASTVRLWDPSDGRLLRELKGHTSGVTAVVFAPAGSVLASASHDATIRLWDTANGRLIRKIGVPDESPPPPVPELFDDGQRGGVVAIAFSPDGRWLASGGFDGSVRLWDVESGKAIRSMRGHGREVTSLLFSRDGKVLTSGGRDNAIRLWDPTTANELQPRDGHDGPVHAVAVSPDGRTAAVACEGRCIRLWSLATAQELRTIRGIPGDIYSLAFSPDGRAVACAASDRIVRIWATATGREMQQLRGHTGAVYTVAFSKAHNLLISSGDDGVLRFWDWIEGKQVRQVPNNRFITEISLSRDGRILAAGGEQPRFLQVATGKEIRQAGLQRTSVALAADGRTYVTHAANGMVQVWDLASGAEQWSFPGPAHGPGWVGSPRLQLSPDGRLLAVTEDTGVAVWEMLTGKDRRRFAGHHTYARHSAFAPDGRTVLTGSEDTTVLVWDLTRRQEIPPGRIAPARLEELWRDLGGADAERADLAIATFAARPEQSLPLLAKRLAPATLADPKHLAPLLRDLDSDDFASREGAMTELRRLGEQAAPALKQARVNPPSLEARRRIDDLLAKLRPPLPASEILQSLRGVETLERIDTPEARALLRKIAAGPPLARLTEDAITALARLERPPD